jgi:hypothetical protein
LLIIKELLSKEGGVGLDMASKEDTVAQASVHSTRSVKTNLDPNFIQKVRNWMVKH